jgi:hypothetical protein
LWVFDLIARDDLVRRRALVRHQALLTAASEANHWSNRVWAEAGTPTPVELHLAAEMDQARAAYHWHCQQTIFGQIDAFWSAERADLVARSMYAPFAVLYLQWEARYPQEWGSARLVDVVALGDQRRPATGVGTQRCARGSSAAGHRPDRRRASATVQVQGLGVRAAGSTRLRCAVHQQDRDTARRGRSADPTTRAVHPACR